MGDVRMLYGVITPEPQPIPRNGKNVHQGGQGQYNYDFGSNYNDNFFQGGRNNLNVGIGGAGRDNFAMNGYGNYNYADGGQGSDKFNLGGHYNVNLASGGQGNDVFNVAAGYGNNNYIYGGSGYDTANLQGSRDDYYSFKDDKGSHYYNYQTNSWTHLNGVENIAFTDESNQIPPVRTLYGVICGGGEVTQLYQA